MDYLSEHFALIRKGVVQNRWCWHAYPCTQLIGLVAYNAIVARGCVEMSGWIHLNIVGTCCLVVASWVAIDGRWTVSVEDRAVLHTCSAAEVANGGVVDVDIGESWCCRIASSTNIALLIDSPVDVIYVTGSEAVDSRADHEYHGDAKEEEAKDIGAVSGLRRLRSIPEFWEPLAVDRVVCHWDVELTDKIDSWLSWEGWIKVFCN